VRIKPAGFAAGFGGPFDALAINASRTREGGAARHFPALLDESMIDLGPDTGFMPLGKIIIYHRPSGKIVR